MVIKLKTTIAVSRKTRAELHRLKIEIGVKNFDELINMLIKEFKKVRFLEASVLFKKRLSETSLTLEDILNES